MNRSGFFETIVGLIVVAVATGFMVYTYGVTNSNIGGGKYKLDAVFGRVDGVDVGSDVRIAGVTIGNVNAQKLDTKTYEADLRLVIDSNVPIPDDSVAKVASDGLLGGAYIAIEPGASEEYFVDGDKITITQGSVDLLGLAVQTFTAPKGGGDTSDAAVTELAPLGDL